MKFILKIAITMIYYMPSDDYSLAINIKQEPNTPDTNNSFYDCESEQWASHFTYPTPVDSSDEERQHFALRNQSKITRNIL